MNTKLLIKFFMSGMMVFIVSVLMLSFHLLRPLESRYLDLGLPYLLDFRKIPVRSDLPIAALSLSSVDLSSEQYMRACWKLAPILKQVGAKVTVVPLPRNLPLTPENQSVLSNIDKLGNVVLADPLRIPPLSFLGSETELHPSNWWAQHPARHRVELTWGASTAQIHPPGIVYKFVPNRYRDFDSGDTIPDVSLQILKKYFNYSQDEIVQTPYEVRLGSYTIPLAGDGYAYTKFSFQRDYRKQVSAVYFPMGDSIAFGTFFWDIPIDIAWASYKDRIVFIDWYGLTVPSSSFYLSPSIIYERILAAVFDRNFVTKYDEWDLSLIFLIVLLLSVLGHKLRPPMLVFFSLLLCGGLLYLSLYLFARQNILIDPIYALVTIGLCTFVFPLVKIHDQKRALEEKVASLQEELKRLQGIVRAKREEERRI